MNLNQITINIQIAAGQQKKKYCENFIENKNPAANQ